MSRLRLIAAWAVLICVSSTTPLAVPAWGQSQNYGSAGGPQDDGLELLQVEPYDVLYFTAASGGGWAKTLPLALPGRRVPTAPTGTLTFSVVGLEGQRFGAKWSEIERIDLWEDKLQREAKARIARGDFTGAYPFLAILLRDYPQVPGLRGLRNEFLFNDAARRFKEGQYDATLAMLEELRRYDPTYQPERVLSVISGVADRLMQKRFDAGQLDQAQQLLARLRSDYPNNGLASLAQRTAGLLGRAQTGSLHLYALLVMVGIVGALLWSWRHV